MKFANTKYIEFGRLPLKSLSLVMQLAPDQNVGLTIISFLGHVHVCRLLFLMACP